MMITKLGHVFLLAMLLVPAVGLAQKTPYYRWADAAGVVHYGDTPPASGHATKVTVSDSAPKPAEALPVAAKQPSTLGDAETAARQRNCDSARANIRTLDSGALLADASDPANIRRLTADERTAQRGTAQSNADAYCGGGAAP